MKFNTRRIRAGMLIVLVLSVFVLYSVRLMKMQIVDGEEYLNLANSGYTQTQTVAAARGEITDRNGVLLAKNKTVYNVVLDKAYFPTGKTDEETQKLMNDIILDTVQILKEQNEDWIDNLPISKSAPFSFDENNESAVNTLKSFLNIGSYASVDDAIHWLKDRYCLGDYTDEEFRILAGIRYEMEQTGFSVKNRYTLAEDITMETVTKIKESSIRLPGVDTDVSTTREYVNGDVLPHLLGGVGPIYAENKDYYLEKGYDLDDIVGTSGIEALMEDYLKGTDGERALTMDADGNVISSEETKAPIPGNSVRLTIDSEMQRVALDALKLEIDYLNKYAPAGEGREACAGAVVAMDVKTGEILTMASYPSYNLETYQEDYEELAADELKPLYNRALKGTYTPGSIFKPVTSTAALESGLIDEYSTVTCQKVYTYFDSYQPKCLSYHGTLNVIDALRQSCNIFFYDVGRRVGIEKIAYYAEMYGLGQYTGIEFEDTDYPPAGVIASPEEREAAGGTWYAGDVLQAAIGQSDNKFTPLQLASYCATIANQGVRYNAHIIKDIQDYNTGEVIEETETRVMSDMNMSDYTYETILKGLKAAAGPTGTSYGLFNNYPVTVAAKTGTPETAEFPNSTYIAFAPADDPQIAVCVVIEKGWHGYTGAPVAKYIFNQYFGIDQDVKLIA